LNKVVSIAVSGIFDSIILELTQKLQTFVEFEAMPKNLRDLEIVDIDGEGNARTALRICRFAGIEFDLRSVKVRMGPFIAKVELEARTSRVVPDDLIGSNPRMKQLPSGFVVFGDNIRLPENIVADIDEIGFRRVDSMTICVLGLFRFRRNNRIVRFEVVERPCFDEIHGSGSGVVVENRREDPREITVHDLKWSLASGHADGGVDCKLDSGDVPCPI
jgi:hypothetical protein